MVNYDHPMVMWTQLTFSTLISRFPGDPGTIKRESEFVCGQLGVAQLLAASDSSREEAIQADEKGIARKSEI
jgi:hypothetical protein